MAKKKKSRARKASNYGRKTEMIGQLLENNGQKSNAWIANKVGCSLSHVSKFRLKGRKSIITVADVKAVKKIDVQKIKTIIQLIEAAQ